MLEIVKKMTLFQPIGSFWEKRLLSVIFLTDVCLAKKNLQAILAGYGLSGAISVYCLHVFGVFSITFYVDRSTIGV